MPLDPQIQQLLAEMEASGVKPSHQLSVEENRAGLAARAKAFPGEPVDLARVEDRTIPGPAGDLAVRLYWPHGTGAAPLLVYFHGGGWATGDLDTHDYLCKLLCKHAGCIVASVAYRLAPESPYPAAVEDAYAATVWAAANAVELGADPQKLAVGGDSAGGNLAAVVSLLARDRSGPAIAYQLLIYPVTDRNFETASYRENATGLMLWREDMVHYWNLYLGDGATGEEPTASPLRAPDLSNLPPALVITAEYDPLRDEGELYADRLLAAGNDVIVRRYRGVVHGFFNRAAQLDCGKAAVIETARDMKAAFIERSCGSDGD